MLLLQTVLSLQRAHADRVKRRRERGENTIHTNEEKRKVARCINFSQRRISGPDLAGPLILTIEATMPDELRVPAPADFHTHLRQDALMHLATPHVRQGGMQLAYVMVSYLCAVPVRVLYRPRVCVCAAAKLVSAYNFDRASSSLPCSIAGHRF